MRRECTDPGVQSFLPLCVNHPLRILFPSVSKLSILIARLPEQVILVIAIFSALARRPLVQCRRHQ